MGLIGDAPGVGIYRETKATALRSKTMPANVARSVGSVPKSREEIPLPTANQTTPPTAIPTNARRNLFAMTPVCSVIVVAPRPRAMRMPICLAPPERNVYKFLTIT
jgi:hypothetical protein